jgi:hypothetical protein
MAPAATAIRAAPSPTPDMAVTAPLPPSSVCCASAPVVVLLADGVELTSVVEELAVLVSVVDVGVADPEAGVDGDEAVPVAVMVTSYGVMLSVSVSYHSPSTPTEHVAISSSCVQTFTAVLRRVSGAFRPTPGILVKGPGIAYCPDASATTLTVDGAWMSVTA